MEHPPVHSLNGRRADRENSQRAESHNFENEAPAGFPICASEKRSGERNNLFSEQDKTNCSAAMFLSAPAERLSVEQLHVQCIL